MAVPSRLEDDIPVPDAGALGRAAGLHAGGQDRAFLAQFRGMAKPARKRDLLGRNADIGAPHPPVPHQLAQHEIRRVGGEPAKPDALAPRG